MCSIICSYKRAACLNKTIDQWVNPFCHRHRVQVQILRKSALHTRKKYFSHYHEKTFPPPKIGKRRSSQSAIKEIVVRWCVGGMVVGFCFKYLQFKRDHIFFHVLSLQRRHHHRCTATFFQKAISYTHTAMFNKYLSINPIIIIVIIFMCISSNKIHDFIETLFFFDLIMYQNALVSFLAALSQNHRL